MFLTSIKRLQSIYLKSNDTRVLYLGDLDQAVSDQSDYVGRNLASLFKTYSF